MRELFELNDSSVADGVLEHYLVIHHGADATCWIADEDNILRF